MWRWSLAAIFSLSGFFGSSSQEQLQAIAKLLTYVQMVLLFQEKSVRIYGQLTMFSLLQVVVAALLNDSLEFGVLLVIYMIIAVFGIALFFVYREVERTGGHQAASPLVLPAGGGKDEVVVADSLRGTPAGD